MTTTLISDSASIRWAAIGAGFLVSVVAGMLLNLLGIGLGFMAFPFYKASAATFGVTSIVWCVATGMVSMFLGGWTAGFFSHTLKRKESLLYGVVTWSLATLIGVFFSLWGGGSLIGGAGSLAVTSFKAVGSESIQLLGGSLAEMLADNEKEISSTIQKQVDRLLSESDLSLEEGSFQVQKLKKNSSQMIKQLAGNNARFQFAQALDHWLLVENKTKAEEAKVKVIEFLQSNTDLSREDVEKVIDDWRSYYQNTKKMMTEKTERAKNEAAKVLEKSATAVGGLALSLFAMLTLGCLASSYGSLVGAKSQSEDTFVNIS